MPAAAPLPRYPTLLTMNGPAGLLTAPGCPVCRYAAEAGDRYLTWFALEGHSDTTAIGRLAGSLGTCARHTRRLMSQPGAAVRLTAVYQYVLRTARERLAGRVTPLMRCPMCEHGEAATGRALDTLLDGLANEMVRQRCRELGGLCIPHLNAAAIAGRRRTIAWLAETMTATLAIQPYRLEWIAGDADQDAELRAVLGRARPVRALPGSYVCLACLAGARAEDACVARVACLSGEDLPEDPDLLLCASHLADATTLACRGPRLTSLLAWQADCHLAARLRGSADLSGRNARRLVAWLRAARRPGLPECAACRVQGAAVRGALDDFRRVLRTSPGARGQRAALCVRHVLSLRAVDPWAGQVITRDAVHLADTLTAELAEAFRKNTWQHHGEVAGAEAAAWRRAAAFLDGSVFCGSAPN